MAFPPTTRPSGRVAPRPPRRVAIERVFCNRPRRGASGERPDPCSPTRRAAAGVRCALPAVRRRAVLRVPARYCVERSAGLVSALPLPSASRPQLRRFAQASRRGPRPRRTPASRPGRGWPTRPRAGDGAGGGWSGPWHPTMDHAGSRTVEGSVPWLGTVGHGAVLPSSRTVGPSTPRDHPRPPERCGAAPDAGPTGAVRLGWPTGVEPVTFGSTIRCSAG